MYTDASIDALATIDYIFLVFAFIVLIKVLAELSKFFFNESNNLPIEIVILIVIGLGITYYIKYIPYGIYQAKYIEYNGKKVGDGTSRSKAFELNLDKECIQRDEGIKIPACSSFLSPYVTKYCNKYTEITITALGTVKYRKGYDKTHSKIKATVDVSY